MSLEDHPQYGRWQAANATLKAAAERRDRASEGEKAAALAAYRKAQEEYDAVVDAMGFGDD